MAFTYKYEVTSLKVKDEVVGNTVNTNAVVQTYWRLTGTDEELIAEDNKNSGSFSGATPFTTTTMPEGYNFIPFDQLTEADVISWIQAVVEGNPGYKQHIDEQIQKQIDQNMRPVTEAQLPWAPVTANTAPSA